MPISKVDEDHLRDWTFGKARRTRSKYLHESRRFLEFAGVPLRQVKREDVMRYHEHLEGQGFGQSTLSQALYILKSLFDFLGCDGTLHKHPMLGVKPPVPKDTLAERILTEDEVHRMLSVQVSFSDGSAKRPVEPLGTLERNRLLLRVLYYSGCRCGEVGHLCWRDVQPNGVGGQLTVYGKGNKTRTVRIPLALYKQLVTFRAGARDADPVFVSTRRNKGNAIVKRHIWRIVHQAAVCAKIGRDVSPHWLRHSHASHALDHGVPLHVLKQTLGHKSIIATERYLHARPTEGSSTYLPDFLGEHESDCVELRKRTVRAEQLLQGKPRRGKRISASSAQLSL